MQAGGRPGKECGLGSRGELPPRPTPPCILAWPRVQSLRSVAGERADDLAYVALLPAATKRPFLDGLGEAVLLEAVPREDANTAKLSELARSLRAADPARVSGLVGARLEVGGLPAFNADYEDAVAGRLRSVILLVVGRRSSPSSSLSARS